MNGKVTNFAHPEQTVGDASQTFNPFVPKPPQFISHTPGGATPASRGSPMHTERGPHRGLRPRGSGRHWPGGSEGHTHRRPGAVPCPRRAEQAQGCADSTGPAAPSAPRRPRPLTRRSPVVRVPAPASRGLATLTGPRARSAAQAPAALAVAPGDSAPSPQPNRARSPARPTPLSLRPGRTAAFSPRPPTATALLVRPAPLRPAPLGPAAGPRTHGRRGRARCPLPGPRHGEGGPENALGGGRLGASPPLPALLPLAPAMLPARVRYRTLLFGKGSQSSCRTVEDAGTEERA